MSRRAENRSANGPPAKYDTMATMPYRENAVPSWRFVTPNTSRNVGRKTRARTKGRRKTASPAAIRAARINPRCRLDISDAVRFMEAQSLFGLGGPEDARTTP